MPFLARVLRGPSDMEDGFTSGCSIGEVFDECGFLRRGKLGKLALDFDLARGSRLVEVRALNPVPLLVGRSKNKPEGINHRRLAGIVLADQGG